MSCEERAKILDEVQDGLDRLECFVSTTKNFQAKIFENYDRYNPDQERLERAYQNSLVLGEVLLDRLMQENKMVSSLLEKIMQIS